MASLSKHWLCECSPTIEYFMKEYVLKILDDKRPSFKFLNLIFKSLAKMFENGKVTVQMYVNFDC